MTYQHGINNVTLDILSDIKVQQPNSTDSFIDSNT
jgi:hypothetical protein